MSSKLEKSRKLSRPKHPKGAPNIEIDTIFRAENSIENSTELLFALIILLKNSELLESQKLKLFFLPTVLRINGLIYPPDFQVINPQGVNNPSRYVEITKSQFDTGASYHHEPYYILRRRLSQIKIREKGFQNKVKIGKFSSYAKLNTDKTRQAVVTNNLEDNLPLSILSYTHMFRLLIYHFHCLSQFEDESSTVTRFGEITKDFLAKDTDGYGVPSNYFIFF